MTQQEYIDLIVWYLLKALDKELSESRYGPGWVKLDIDNAYTWLAYGRVNGKL